MSTNIPLKTPIFRSILAVIIMLVLYSLTATGSMGHNPVGQTANYQNPLIVPAGYAFAIWSIIYLGIIAFPIYQWFQRQTGHKDWKKVHTWFGLNAIANGLWLVCASYDFLWLALAVIVFMLVSLYKINELLIIINKSDERISFWIERFVFSIYFAWITLATALNVSATLQFYNWDGMGLAPVTWALIVLPIVGIIASIVFWKYRDATYAGVIVWAFVALVVRHLESIPMIGYLSGGIALVFILLMLLKSKKLQSANLNI